MKGKGIYHYITNGIEDKMVPKTDPIPEGWEVGRIQKPPGKGRTWYKHAVTGKVKFCIPGTEPEGYVKCKRSECGFKSDKGKLHYVNPETGEHQKFLEGQQPQGWIHSCPREPITRMRNWGKDLFDFMESKEKFSEFFYSIPYENRHYMGIYSEIRRLFPDNYLPYSQLSPIVIHHGLHDDINFNKCMTSHYETDIIDYLKSIKPDIDVRSSHRPHWLILNKMPSELDIYLPEYKLAIEFNGLWCHNINFHEADYHRRKTDLCAEHGIRLIHIFEDEWLNKMHKLKIFLKDLISPPIKFTARKLKIIGVNGKYSKWKSKFNNFYKLYHLQGIRSIPLDTRYDYILCDDECVYAMMTFGQPGRKLDRSCEYELIRYCIKPGYRIVGGAKRLISHFIKDVNPKSIVSYCNRNYFTGDVYKSLGFQYENYSLHYKWVNDYESLDRDKTEKNKLISKYSDKVKDIESKTENQIMEELGYTKLFDAGQDKYIKEIN